jgi:hypothetical protein
MPDYIQIVRFESPVSMKVNVFLDEVSRSLVARYQCFGGTIYQTEWHLIQIHQEV